MNLWKALADAQAEVENATKNAQNPHLKNKYANLEGVLEVVKPVFAKHGLAIVTHPGRGGSDGNVEFTSKLAWSTGTETQTESFIFEMPLGKRDAQGLGSAITYARRYAAAIWANITQEDDDGNAASRGAPKPKVMKEMDAPGPDIAPKEKRDVIPMWQKAIENATTVEVLKGIRTQMGKLPTELQLQLSPLWEARKAKLSE